MKETPKVTARRAAHAPHRSNSAIDLSAVVGIIKACHITPDITNQRCPSPSARLAASDLVSPPFWQGWMDEMAVALAVYLGSHQAGQSRPCSHSIGFNLA